MGTSAMAMDYRVHPLKDFTVGGLNCWENWMPLPRAALYGLGPKICILQFGQGGDHNTKDITRFIARESRSFVCLGFEPNEQKRLL